MGLPKPRWTDRVTTVRTLSVLESSSDKTRAWLRLLSGGVKPIDVTLVLSHWRKNSLHIKADRTAAR